MLDPFKAEDKNSIKILNEAQKNVHESFKDIVKESRGKKLKGGSPKEIEDKLFNGAFWSGEGALDNGLIDNIGSMRNIMHKKYGKKIKFINIEPKKKGFVKELLSSKSDNFEQNIINSIFVKIKEEIYFNKFGL